MTADTSIMNTNLENHSTLHSTIKRSKDYNMDRPTAFKITK